MNVVDVATGVNLNKAIQLAEKLGSRIHPIRLTGELRFEHPLAVRRCVVNARRKDAPRHLIGWLRRVQAAQTQRTHLGGPRHKVYITKILCKLPILR